MLQGMSAQRDKDLTQLTADLLALYKRAAELGELRVAELLLQGLEEIAQTACSCEPARDQAYLHIASSRRDPEA